MITGLCVLNTSWLFLRRIIPDGQKLIEYNNQANERRQFLTLMLSPIAASHSGMRQATIGDQINRSAEPQVQCRSVPQRSCDDVHRPVISWRGPLNLEA